MRPIGTILVWFLLLGTALASFAQPLTISQVEARTMHPYQVLIARESLERCAAYRQALLQKSARPGRLFQEKLTGVPLENLSTEAFLERLVQTKKPQIFAESAVAGDGSDWNRTELSLLGDVSIAVPVDIFDDGAHRNPVIHPEPFPGLLLYVPGALLANGQGHPPVDLEEIAAGKDIDPVKFDRLYERRLLPAFLYADQVAASQGRKAFITVPGLGCGQFAGRFHGRLGRELQRALMTLLQRHGSRLTHVQAVYYDPFRECANEREAVNGIPFLVRPLSRGNEGKSQLCPPQAYAEAGDDFSGGLLCSVVAWDHVSWPGNDFYAGSRATDDGVKAAATSSMKAMTGLAGRYQPSRAMYAPPTPFLTWGQVIASQGLVLKVVGAMSVF